MNHLSDLDHSFFFQIFSLTFEVVAAFLFFFLANTKVFWCGVAKPSFIPRTSQI